jgi:hypothetical protein
MLNRFLVECWLRLRSPEFKHHLEWLKARHEKAKDDCTTLTGDALLRAQGKAAELKEQLETIERAPQMVDKIKNVL